MADQIGTANATREGREEPIVIPPQQFVPPAVPHAPVE